MILSAAKDLGRALTLEHRSAHDMTTGTSGVDPSGRYTALRMTVVRVPMPL
jgi:hypothetical protein